MSHDPRVPTRTSRSDLTGLRLAPADGFVLSRVDGQLLRTHFREGQTVKAGQPLANLIDDDAPRRRQHPHHRKAAP